MRGRHDAKPHASGGGVGDIPKNAKIESYAGTGSKTEQEAEKRARGGKIMKGKMPTMVHGSMPSHHGNRPGRKSGGSVGADMHPMTSAARLSQPEGLSRSGSVDKSDD